MPDPKGKRKKIFYFSESENALLREILHGKVDALVPELDTLDRESTEFRDLVKSRNTMGTIVTLHPAGLETAECPFSVDDLISAEGICGWGYEEKWPTIQWEAMRNDGDPWARRWITTVPQIASLWRRLCTETSVSQDNKQTFEVRISGEIYYVMFKDHCVWIGRTLRER